MGLDARIGSRFLNTGIGFGGSCFPKNTMVMAYMGRQFKSPLELIETTISGNAQRKVRMAERVLAAVKDMPQAKIAVWGLAFKNGTDDCRQSPAMEIINELLKYQAHITAYDPQAMDNARMLLGDKIAYASDMYTAAQNADALVILTEWPQFSVTDLAKLALQMRHKILLDFRNMLDGQKAVDLGFNYQCIGKKY